MMAATGGIEAEDMVTMAMLNGMNQQNQRPRTVLEQSNPNNGMGMGMQPE